MRIARGLAGGATAALASLISVLAFSVVAFGGRLAPHLEHAVMATLLATRPRRDGPLGKLRLSAIAQALQARALA